MNPTPSLFSFFLLQFHYRQNELFTVPVFNFFLSAVSDCIECSQKASCCVLVLMSFCSSISFQMPSKSPFTVSVLNFFSAVPNSQRMHHLASLFSYFSLQFQIVSNAVSITVYRLCFQHFLCSFKPSLCLRFSLQFRIVSNAVRMHRLPSLFLFVSLQFLIVVHTVRMNHLPSLFSKCLCSSKSFEIPSKCSSYRLYFLSFFL